MADFRCLFGKKKDDNDATLDDQSEIEEEKPEDVLISLPKKQQEQNTGEEKAKEKQTNPDWNDQITLEPEEYDDPYEDDKDMTEEIAEENDDIIVGKVNVDENPELCVKYGIVSIPTLIAFKNGEIIGQKLGAIPKANILEMFE